MKKLLAYLTGLILIMSVVAFGPPVPIPFVTYYVFDGAPITGLPVTFTCGETITKTTNENGGIHIDLGEGGTFNNCISILTINCGYEACNKQYNLNVIDLSKPYTGAFTLSEAPPLPEPECIADSDCNAGYECVDEHCVEIVEPEPEPVVEDKVNSNTDGTIASVESNFGSCVDVIITDSKLTKLFDGIIDFDTEDYDVHEEIQVKYCIETSIDDVDYGLDPYVLIEEEGIEYRYVFDDIISFTKDDDEELEINFSGEDIVIISLSSSKVIIRHGELFDYQDGCVEGEEIIYEGLPVSIGTINDDFVYLSYNGESGKITQKTKMDVGGVQIYVEEAIPNKDKPGLCEIRIAEDVEEIIDDGYEYNEDWEYSVGEGYIGLRNRHDFKYLDEETKPLALGDKIVFPNDFATVKFNEITDSETTEIRIKLRDGLFNVFGEREDGQEDSFTYNNQDYDALFVSAEGILDEDKVFISNKVRIGESDVYIEKGSITIGDLTIEFDFLDILYKAVSYAADDDNYLTYEGIIFKNPENSVKDQSTFNIIVPDEIPEITVTIGAESETIGIEPEPIICTPEDCAEVTCPDSPTCPSCPPVPETLCPEEKVCPPVTTNLAAIIITGILGLAGGAGIFFKLFNKKIFTSSNTGLKTYRGRDGTLKIYHKHPGTTGYHNPETSHRAPETHPKGMLDVKNGYQKNSSGDWEYVG